MGNKKVWEGECGEAMVDTYAATYLFTAAGVAICMPEMAEIHAKLQRDFVERGNKLLQRTGRKARSDDDDEEDDDVKKKADKQTADKHAAELKSRDRKIGELTRLGRHSFWHTAEEQLHANAR